MSVTLQFFRANTGAVILASLLGMGTLVMVLVGALMLRAGVSLKPTVFFAGFFAIIVLPQAALHFSQALGWIPKNELVWTPGGKTAASPYRAREDLLNIRGGRFAQPAVAIVVDRLTDTHFTLHQL